jgi:transcriptional regulator with XRE-family HTH domain
MVFFNKGRKIDTDAGARIRKARESMPGKSDAKCMSMEDFGEMVGFTKNYIYKLETGRKELTLESAVQISRLADIDFIWLITGIEIKV